MAGDVRHKYNNPAGVGGQAYRIADIGGDPIEARKQIARQLRYRSFGINVNPVIKSEIVTQVGELDNDVNIEAAIVTSGVIMANAYWDGTDNTGLLYQGHYAVFDSVTGRAVTGINSKWSPEEYTVIGVACQDAPHAGLQGFARVPILIGNIQPPDVIRFGVLTEDLIHGGSAEVTFDNYDPDRGFHGQPLFQQIGTMVVHTGVSGRNLIPSGKKLPTGSVVIMGLQTANAVPVWILLGSPVCPIDI